MSRSNDNISPKSRKRFSSNCSRFHNSKSKCNKSEDNGVPCIYKSGDHYSAPRCSPITAAKRRINSMISEGKALSREDIVSIRKIRVRDKKELEKLRSAIIKSKDQVKQQKIEIDNLLRALKLEKQNHRELLNEAKQKSIFEKEEIRNKKRILENQYKSQLAKMEKDYVSKLAKSAEINSYRAKLEKIVIENHKRKIK